MRAYRNIQVFDFWPQFDGPELSQFTAATLESRGYGLAVPWGDPDLPRCALTLPILAQGLAEVQDLRRFSDRHRGRLRPFWVLSWVNDLALQADAAAGATTITVAGHGYSSVHGLGDRYRYIALLTATGKLECYGVASVDGSGANDVLTLSRGLTTAMVASVTVCCPLLLVRFSDDEIGWDYLSGALVSGELKFIEVSTEYPPVTEELSGLANVHFGSRPTFLYRISDGTTTLHLADYGVDVLGASQTWQASDLRHSGLTSSWDMLGDDLTVTLRTDDPTHPLKAYLNELNLPNFTIELFAADMETLETFTTSAPDHIGRLESVDFDPEGAIELRVSSLFRLNEREVPTMRMQRTCNWRTFGPGCGAVEATFTTAGTITGLSADPAYVEAAEFGAKATAEADPNWFALGKVTVGGERRLCTGQAGNRLYLNFPFVAAAIGNPVSAVAGDDKRVGTCDQKFGQLANHSGAPYMPNDNPQIAPLKTPAATGGKK